MAMAQGDVYRVAAQLLTVVGSDEQVNVFHYQQVGGGQDESDVVSDMDARLGGLYSAINAHVTEGLRYVGAEIDNVTKGTKAGFATDWAAALGTGDAVDEALPPQVTALILGRTLKLRVQGRKYLPLFTEAANLAGNWAPAVMISLGEFADLYVTFFVGGSGNSYSPGTMGRSPSGGLGDFTSFVESKVIAQARTQKSRYFAAGS